MIEVIAIGFVLFLGLSAIVIRGVMGYRKLKAAREKKNKRQINESKRV